MKRSYSTPLFVCAIVFGIACGSSATTSDSKTTPATTEDQTVKSELVSDLSQNALDAQKTFIRSLGIMADVPTNLKKVAGPNMLRLFATDNSFEYYATSEKTLTPEMMRNSFKVGLDMGDGLYTRSIGEAIPLGDKAEAFNFGVFRFKDNGLVFKGYQIHDWSTTNGIFVISVMSAPEKHAAMRDKCIAFYQSVEFLSSKQIKELKEKTKAERLANGRNAEEQEIYTRIADKALLWSKGPGQPTNVPFGAQKFELCSAGNGNYTASAGGNIGTGTILETHTGEWDIMEDEFGVMKLVINDHTKPEVGWEILIGMSGNPIIGGLEFFIANKGDANGPAICD